MHFISGLPRSGSTLMSAILRQNPRFHAGMSSPVASLFEGVLAQVSAGSELSTMVDQAQRARLLRGLFDSYYDGVKQPVIFDTNRAWTSQLPALMTLFPDAKIICCVRDVAWVMDSIERQFRNNAFENTRLFNNAAERSTVYTRVEALANANRMVGFPWHALREACFSDYATRLVLVEYDLVAARPAEVFKLIYDFLGEVPFQHDFSNVEYDAPAFDAQLGLDGLHRVHPKVEARPRQTILPPDLFERYSKLAFWRDMPTSKVYRIVAQAEGTQKTAMPQPTQKLDEDKR
jgi:sulfotransferase